MSTDPTPGSDPPLSAYEGGTLGAGIDWADPNSPLAPLYLTTGGVVAVVVLGLAVLLFAAVPLWHTDFWSHLAYGERIAAAGALPDRESLSPFTDPGAGFFDPAWLTQVGYHALYRAGSGLAGGDPDRRLAGGIEFVRLAHLLLAVGTVGLVGLACRRASGSVAWATGGMLLVLVALVAPLAVQRPQAFGVVCFAALMCGLSRAVPSRRFVCWAPAVMVLWANLHGSFAVGFALLGGALFGRAVEVGRTESLSAVWRDPSARRLALALVLALAAVAVLNPYGPRLYLEVVRFGGHPNLRTVTEWQPLDFSQPRGGHWGYLASVILLTAAQAFSPRPLSPFQMVLLLTFGLWPLAQQRALMWWFLLVPWVAAPHLAAGAGARGWELPESVPNFRRTVLAAILFGLAVVASPAADWAKTGAPRPLDRALHRGTPVAVAAALRGEPGPDPERVKELGRLVREWHGGRFAGRVFASDIQGDYLVRALPAEAPVMMFNHAHAFAPDYWAECLLVKAAGPGWWEVLDRYRVGLVVVEADQCAALCAALRAHPGWAVAVDEAKAPTRDQLSRLFVAVRRPVGEAVPVAPPPRPKGGTP